MRHAPKLQSAHQSEIWILNDKRAMRETWPNISGTAENQHQITSQAILEEIFSVINSVIKLGVQTTEQLL